MKMNSKYAIYLSAAVVSLAGVGSLAVASADSTTSSQNRLPSYTMREDRLTAQAEVLGTTPSNLETTLKTETMKQLLASKNLTAAEFHADVKAQLTKDLEAQGYSSTQVTKALSSHHHKAKK
jgi:hypothetical protein